MSNLTLWSRPFDVERWASEFFGPARDHVAVADWFQPLPAAAGSFTPATEIETDGDDAVIRLELPGLNVETPDQDVSVDFDRGRLVVHGERRDERAEQKDGRTLREMRYGSFRRSFNLPEHVSSGDIAASYDAGVLTVRVAGVYKQPTETEAQHIAITT